MLLKGSNHLLYYLKYRCILEARNPDELASFSNKIFMKEVRIFCLSGLTTFEVQVVYRRMLPKSAAQR